MKDIIIVDDEKDIRTLLSTILEDEGYEVRTAANSSELFETLKGRLPKIILLDIWLKKSDLDGMEILYKLRQYFPDIDVVMISGHGNIQTSVRAMQIGACHFLEKPVKTDYLLLILERLLSVKRLKHQQSASIYTNQASKETPAFLRGHSEAIKQVKSSLLKNIDKDSRILLTGAPGSGKYNMAEYIHHHSPRASGHFVAMRSNIKMDAAALEKELFGYSNPNNPEYVGAVGALEKAHLGTIYLEDIDLYPHAIQKKMVKFLVDKKFNRFMSPEKVVQSNVRMIASLSVNAKEAIANGLLLNDLYTRISTTKISLPNLQERHEDIPELIKAYTHEIAFLYDGFTPTYSDELMTFFKTYSWQKNLREMRALLKSLISDAYTRHAFNKPITLEHLPSYFKAQNVITGGGDSILERSLNMPLREAREVFEKHYLIAQLARFKGNISKTAQFIGMERSALHRKMRSLEVENQRDSNQEMLEEA